MALSWVPWQNDPQVQRAENSSPSMKPGTSGQHVHLLQAALILQGFDVPHHGITGNPPRQNNNYMSETQAAVRACETRFGLTLDSGIAGREVVQRLDLENTLLYTTRAGQFGAALARTDVSLAISKVTSALLALTFINVSTITTLVNDALRAHFRLLPPGTTGDGIRRARTQGDIDRIMQTYQALSQVFASNGTSFLDGIPVNGVKIAAEANTNSRQILFGPAFRSFTVGTNDLTGGLIGPNSRAAILIHEGMHSVDASGTSGNPPIHISEFNTAQYDSQPANLALFNPSSYAGFAAHIANNGDPNPRFGLGDQSRAL